MSLHEWWFLAAQVHFFVQVRFHPLVLIAEDDFHFWRVIDSWGVDELICDDFLTFSLFFFWHSIFGIDFILLSFMFSFLSDSWSPWLIWLCTRTWSCVIPIEKISLFDDCLWWLMHLMDIPPCFFIPLEASLIMTYSQYLDLWFFLCACDSYSGVAFRSLDFLSLSWFWRRGQFVLHCFITWWDEVITPWNSAFFFFHLMTWFPWHDQGGIWFFFSPMYVSYIYCPGLNDCVFSVNSGWYVVCFFEAKRVFLSMRVPHFDFS